MPGRLNSIYFYGYLENTDTGQRGHGHVKIRKKAVKAENEKKSYHPFYKVTILCEIIVRVTVRVRLSILSVSGLSVSALSVFALSGVRVFQITYFYYKIIWAIG